MTGYVLDALLLGLVIYQEWLRRTENKKIMRMHETLMTETKADCDKRIAELQTKLAAVEEQLQHKDEQCLSFAVKHEEISKVKADCDGRIAEIRAACDARVADMQTRLTETERRLRETETQCERRVAAEREVARAAAEPAVASYSFSLQKESGRIFKTIREITLMATFHRGQLVFWSGDASYMEELKIPPPIKKAIQGAVAAAQVMTGGAVSPRLS